MSGSHPKKSKNTGLGSTPVSVEDLKGFQDEREPSEGSFLAQDEENLKIFSSDELINMLRAAQEEKKAAQEREEKLVILLSQATFNNKLDFGFLSRDEFIHEAEKACFTKHLPFEKSSNTDNFVHDSSVSDYNKSGFLQMSKVHRRHLAHGKDKMNVRYIKVENLRERVEHYVLGLEKVNDFKVFFQSECNIITLFRDTLAWLRANVSGYNELALQRAYILYIRGLLEAMGETKKSVFSVNAVDLETQIEVKRKDRMQLEKVGVRGKSDCAFGPNSSVAAPVDTDDLTTSIKTLVELKVNNGPLQKCNSSVGSCTSQQLVEMLALANMKRERIDDYRVICSVLTDFFYIRIAFRTEHEGCLPSYFVSTLHDEVESFVLLTILMISEQITEAELKALLEKSGDLVGDNEGSDDENDEDLGGKDSSSDGSDAPGVADLSSKFAAAAALNTSGRGRDLGDGGGEKYSGRALKPLSLNMPNVIMTMGDDPEEEAQREGYRKLAVWEASLSFLDVENIGPKKQK